MGNIFSALIGAGGSLLGGLMNTSSQQAINQQQLQFAQGQAQGYNLGPYYKNLVSAATNAGINPLAVIGGGGGSGGSLTLSNPRPGDAISNSLGQIANMQMPDPKVQQSQDLDLELKKSQLRNDAVSREVELRRAGLDGRGGVQAGESVFRRALGVPPGKEPAFPFGQVEQGGNLIGAGVRYLNDWWSRQKDPFGMSAH